MSTVDESHIYKIFEVFSKRNVKTPIQHQFSLLAPNEEMAFMMAQENFMRREDVIDVWVVERENIGAMPSGERQAVTKVLDNKDHSTTRGYGYLPKKWREKEQGMLDEKEIIAWKEVNKKLNTS